MKLAFSCLRCGKAHSVTERLAGRKIRCQACGQIQRIPTRLARERDRRPEPDVYALASTPPAPEPVAVTNTRGSIRPEKRKSATRRSGLGFWCQFVRAAAGESSLLERESFGLIALSAADLLVTYALLGRGPSFYESNPMAQWFFLRWNMAGMTLFKFSAMSLVIVIGEYIERRRPGWGRGLLLISCLATAAVVAHGLRLFLGYADNGVPIP